MVDSKQVRAAMYMRMSTDMQEYSIPIQEAVIRDYASRHNIVIASTYADEGRSGLNVKGRASLRRLLKDVQSGTDAFDVILVYDVSRWGRFQDTDEGSYYEFLCRQAGKEVRYCSESFENDGSAVSTLVKAIKRLMAAEYSKDLSAKVTHGVIQRIKKGHRGGGMSGYGLRRQVITCDGSKGRILGNGEKKGRYTDYVTLVPGPSKEVTTVKHIFNLYNSGLYETAIAQILNCEGPRSDREIFWTLDCIKGILTNEKYIGHNIYSRTTGKLKSKRVQNPASLIIRYDNAYEAIIEPKVFLRAQEERARRKIPITCDEMLKLLKNLLKKKGELTTSIIDDAHGVPTAGLYKLRFGSLLEAYKKIGYKPKSGRFTIDVSRKSRSWNLKVVNQFLGDLKNSSCTIDQHDGRITINRTLKIYITIAHCSKSKYNRLNWRVLAKRRSDSDFIVVVRLDEGNDSIRDYLVLPSAEFRKNFIIGEANEGKFTQYRVSDLAGHFVKTHPEGCPQITNTRVIELIRANDVLKILRVSKNSLGFRIKHFGFPEPIALGVRSVCWDKSAVMEWMAVNKVVVRTGRPLSN